MNSIFWSVQFGLSLGVTAKLVQKHWSENITVLLRIEPQNMSRVVTLSLPKELHTTGFEYIVIVNMFLLTAMRFKERVTFLYIFEAHIHKGTAV